MTSKNGVEIVALGESVMGDKEKDQWLEMFNEMADRHDEWKYEYDTYFDNNQKVDIETDATVVFTAGASEMLKITEDGFYVRGVRVEQDANEAAEVYRAFREYLTWAIISRSAEK